MRLAILLSAKTERIVYSFSHRGQLCIEPNRPSCSTHLPARGRCRGHQLGSRSALMPLRGSAFRRGNAQDFCSTPPEKVDWTLSDIHGWTVAHVAAQSSGELPAGFRGWPIRAIDGQTVAHAFLMSGKPFPDDFPLEVWREEDEEGISVIEKAKASGRIDLVAQYECSVIQANRSQDIFGDARITRRRV